MRNKMGIHDGHRQRLRNRMEEQGLDGFADHEILELLLTFALPRIDTNALAHGLIDEFGSFAGVLDAPEEELMRVKGIGENAACLLHMMPQLCRKYLEENEKRAILDSSEKSGRYLLPRYVGRTVECVFLICLDSKCRVLSSTLLHTGSVNSAEVSTRRIVQTALKYNAGGVILSHNHPGGMALPSQEDLETTRRVAKALEGVGISLLDHIIVADGDFVSMADSGWLRG